MITCQIVHCALGCGALCWAGYGYAVRPHVPVLGLVHRDQLVISYIYLTPFPDDSSSVMSVGEVFGWIISL